MIESAQSFLHSRSRGGGYTRIPVKVVQLCGMYEILEQGAPGGSVVLYAAPVRGLPGQGPQLAFPRTRGAGPGAWHVGGGRGAQDTLPGEGLLWAVLPRWWPGKPRSACSRRGVWPVETPSRRTLSGRAGWRELGAPLSGVGRDHSSAFLLPIVPPTAQLQPRRLPLWHVQPLHLCPPRVPFPEGLSSSPASPKVRRPPLPSASLAAALAPGLCGAQRPSVCPSV